MFNGYLTLDGVEIVNSTRFEQYTKGTTWFRPAINAVDLPTLLGTAGYVDPATDNAPWYDPDVPASADFYGCYPIGVSGVEDSSRAGNVVQSTLDGGTPGRIRHTTKEMVWSLMLGGGSEEAVEYGIRWLRKALLGAPLSVNDVRDQPLGTLLTYLSATPVLGEEDNPEIMRTLLYREIRQCAASNGPTMTMDTRVTPGCGGAVATCQFTITAGDPFTYGWPVDVIDGWHDPDVTDPWVGLFEGTIGAAYTYTEEACNAPQWLPMYDPACPAAAPPPTPPNVPLGCWTVPGSWSRIVVKIPQEYIPVWGERLPVIQLLSGAGLRSLRIRFYTDTDGLRNPDVEPCDHLTDMVVSYIPPGANMEIDTTTRKVHVTTAGGALRRADSLVFNTRTEPIEWPILTGGVQHLMVIDLLAGQEQPIIDLVLVPRAV